MKRFRTSLRARLRLGLGAMVAALAILAVAAVLSLDRLGGAVATILRENYASVILCEQMKEALERQDSATLFAAVGHERIADPMLAQNRESFAAAFAREQANLTVPGEAELVREIGELYRDYVATVDGVFAGPVEGRSDAYFHELLPRFTRLKDRVQNVLRLNQTSMEDADHAAKQLARRTVRTAILVSLAAVLFALWFAWRLPRAITRPIEGLTRSARAVGEGDLDVVVEEPDVTELAALAVAFTRMTARLRAYRESSLGELLAAKDLARSTLECMLDPVVVWGRDGAALLANEAATQAFGIEAGTADEIRTSGRPVPEAITIARDEVFATGLPVLPRSLAEAMPRHAPDGDRHYLVRAAPLRSAPGEQPGAIVVAQDVTRFRRIDELKSDLVATVSHEFKTPLTSLRMATHLLLEPGMGELSEAQREIVTTARDDTERLRAMVEDLLDVVRIEAEAGALHRVPVEPFGLLCEVADAHRTVARDKGVVIEVAPLAAPGLVSLDPERIAIALANLVANAIRHTPSGGVIKLSATRDATALRVVVTDTGNGIDPAFLPRIFERSVSLGESAQGEPSRHGLGLAIAKEIAVQHGGEIVATSEPGHGSVFTLVIPFVEN
jgi:signal transduction histidine kinase/HAMP domain-containing protein